MTTIERTLYKFLTGDKLTDDELDFLANITKEELGQAILEISHKVKTRPNKDYSFNALLLKSKFWEIETSFIDPQQIANSGKRSVVKLIDGDQLTEEDLEMIDAMSLHELFKAFVREYVHRVDFFGEEAKANFKHNAICIESRIREMKKSSHL